jgi:uncharacterized protein YaiI (UPF0178 family)
VLVLYVDADACPVKEEIYRVAGRYGLEVRVVAGAPLRVPREPGITMIVAGDRFDAADDWIAARIGAGDICITSDIPLAARCLDAGAIVLGPTGRPFTEASIGGALATRALMQHLRETGAATGGPAPLTARDRSRFLSALDEAVNRVKRLNPAPPGS